MENQTKLKIAKILKSLQGTEWKYLIFTLSSEGKDMYNIFACVTKPTVVEEKFMPGRYLVPKHWDNLGYDIHTHKWTYKNVGLVVDKELGAERWDTIIEI